VAVLLEAVLEAVLLEAKVPDGQVETHLPDEAKNPSLQVRQKLEEPEQVSQDDGQELRTHVLFDSENPGKHPVHWASFIVEAAL